MRTKEFRALGSACRLVVDGGADELIDHAHRLIVQLEQKWSRFVETSEVSMLNRNAGNFVIVSQETYDLLAHAVNAMELTSGRFNPLMLEQLRVLGYTDRWEKGRPTPSSAGWPASLEPIELLPEARLVRIPVGTGFDPGGIGKGLAADMVTDLLVEAGATSTSVELGGDVRVSGEAWVDGGWNIGVANPFDDAADIASFQPEFGAVATSSRLHHRWSVDNRELHHLLDPATGEPAATNVVAVTTCSTTTWWAEVAAKVALIAGCDDAIDLLRSFGTPGVVVTADGAIHNTTKEMVSP